MIAVQRLARQGDRALGERHGDGTRVDHPDEAGLPEERQDLVAEVPPGHVACGSGTKARQRVAQAERLLVEVEHPARVGLLRLDGQRGPRPRLRQPWCCGAEAERGAGDRPRQRYAAAVSARATGPERSQVESCKPEAWKAFRPVIADARERS